MALRILGALHIDKSKVKRKRVGAIKSTQVWGQEPIDPIQERANKSDQKNLKKHEMKDLVVKCSQNSPSKVVS